MKTISAAALNALTGQSGFDVRATVLTSYQSGLHPVGTTINVMGGDVIHDGTADIRATLDLITDGTNMWPTTNSSLLAPYGNEIFVERAVKYGQETEWIPQGYFRIDSPDQSVVPDGPIRLAGSDRMAGIIDAELLTPRQFRSTLSNGAVVQTLVFEVYPGATIEWDSAAVSGALLGRTLVAEESRFKFLNDLITSLGKIWYWDHRGILVIKDVPSTSGASVWTVSSGPHGVLTAIDRKLTRKGVYNAVVATGEAADTTAPSRAIAYDNNPDSPTYYFGRFGPVPRRYSSPFITTNAQALSAARAILTRGLGLPYNINFSAVPNPALEPYDVTTVTYPAKSRSGETFTEIHIVDRITVPLSVSAPITANTREQSVVLIGGEI